MDWSCPLHQLILGCIDILWRAALHAKLLTLAPFPPRHCDAVSQGAPMAHENAPPDCSMPENKAGVIAMIMRGLPQQLDSPPGLYTPCASSATSASGALRLLQLHAGDGWDNTPLRDVTTKGPCNKVGPTGHAIQGACRMAQQAQPALWRMAHAMRC